MNRALPIAATAALVLLADQCAKFWARTHLTTGLLQPFIPGVLRLTLATNTGGAFSLARGNNQLLSWVVLAFILVILLWVYRRERSAQPPETIERVGIGFLLGGALGNLVDRLLLGRVTDFLDFAFISFPVFNLADVCIDIGLILIIAAPYVRRRNSRQSGQTVLKVESANHNG